MTLQQLRYLVEISKCQSITLAAQRLFIAQPSLSKSIKDLERNSTLPYWNARATVFPSPLKALSF